MSEFWGRTLSSSPSLWAVTYSLYSLESHWPADVQGRNKHNSVLPTTPASCLGVFSLHVAIFWALPQLGVNEMGRMRQWVINYLWEGRGDVSRATGGLAGNVWGPWSVSVNGYWTVWAHHEHPNPGTNHSISREMNENIKYNGMSKGHRNNSGRRQEIPLLLILASMSKTSVKS